MTEHIPPEEIEGKLDELGVDVDLSQQNVDVGFEDVSEDGMRFTEATIVKPVIAHRHEPVGEVREEVILDDRQIVLNVQKRPECPSCSYIPTQEEDSITLTGNCVVCEAPTCPNCGDDCFSCDQKLCRHHKDGYGIMGEVLCDKHRRDVEREKEAEWNLQWREMLLKEKKDLRESEREMMETVQGLRLEQEIERKKQEIAAFEAKSKHMDRQRQRELERDKHELDKAQTFLEEQRKHKRLALDEEIERREQALDEWETQKQKEIEVAEQALKQREQEFTEKKFDREQTHKEDKFEKEHRFEKEKFRKEHQLDRDEFEHDVEMDHREQDLDERKHETERDDKYAKRDIEQQKVQVKKEKQEVEAWVKKRRQKLREWKAKNGVKSKKPPGGNGGGPSGGGSSSGPSWNDLAQMSDEMQDIPIIEVKN
ncbi:hypothetical protein [Halococcus sediminicola]|uniref:hypothetical protein n=1 Tax=Halococcus sediminicola TaxID=1264579 RepID=UPI00067893AD|nr:hypothetical protein [Halococcus sediminicola]